MFIRVSLVKKRIVDDSNWFQQAALKSSSIICQVISVLSFTAV